MIRTLIVTVIFFSSYAWGQSKPLPQEWDYAGAMKQVHARSHGRPGVVLHVGDSITYANPYGAWARAGAGQTAQDKGALKWMHCGADDDTDGWYLARFDHPDGGRSYTACGGIRIDEMLAGGKQNLPPLKDLLDKYQPQIVVFMLGTNDVTAGRAIDAYRKDLEKAVGLILQCGIIPIVSTIPPYPRRVEKSREFNDAIRGVAKEHHLPLIDYEREILTRRPDDWNGTLLGKDDVHPSANQGGATPASAPTEKNLRNSGYLLRGWLSVKKIEEVKEAVIDPTEKHASEHEESRFVYKPSASEIRLPVTRDVFLASEGEQAQGNNGGSSQLKLKSIQELSLIDIDPSPLKGRVIKSAVLHVKHRSGEIMRRVTVGSLAADWVEGSANGYEPQKGSSSFRWRQNADVPWSFPGSDLTSVMLGQGGTIWHSAEASAPDAEGWQHVPVDPAVVVARVAGIGFGFVLLDDTGSEWTRDGERFTLQLFPNRFFHSRESGPRNAPYLTVEMGERDDQPPAAPTELRSEVGDLPAGESFVSWITPADGGASGTVGFLVDVDGKAVPRYLIPAAGKPGQRVTMHLRDLNISTGQSVQVSVKAVDGAGNVGPPATARVVVSSRSIEPLPGTMPTLVSGSTPLPRLGETEVAIVDTLDKVQPVTGQMIPPQEAGYLSVNPLWNAAEKRIHLCAAKNEFVSFQVLFRGRAKDAAARLAFEGAGPAVSFYRFKPVPSEAGPVPDALVPCDGTMSIPPGDRSGSLLCELYVPHESHAGEQHGTLTLTCEGKELKLAVDLTVWDFTLPDVLSFIPEMNCYGLPDNERDYYRLAHRNRTVINRVPYAQTGTISDGCAPRRDGRSFDWTAWDKRFGPYLDGSAFSDLPRKSVPLDVFYLPLNENWPSPMEGNYNGSYWADHAFPSSYREAFVDASRQFADHFNRKHWDQTLFECFFNGKNNFKERGWSHGSSPWLLDEPANFQDYWALRWFGLAFHDGIRLSPGPAKMVFRCDISRPQWQRDALDDVLNVNVVAGGPFHEYHRLVIDRKCRLGQIVFTYGTTNSPTQSNIQPVGWCLDSWTLGADGVVPWQTIGSDDSWKHADATCLFYPGEHVGLKEPVPSVRLKAYLRGEQDVEYLAILAQQEHQSPIEFGRRVRAALSLEAVRKSTGFTGDEDAGMIDFAALRPQDLWKLRTRVGRVLNELHPPPQRKLRQVGARESS